jgi:hypothetical protein
MEDSNRFLRLTCASRGCETAYTAALAAIFRAMFEHAWEQ